MTTTTPPLPAIVASIIQLAEPHIGVPQEFREAWNAMPTMVADFVHEHDEAPRWRLVDVLSGREQAEKHPNHPDTNKDMARAVAALCAVNEDMVTDLVTPIADAAFYVGVAFAAYMLLDGRLVTSTQDGAR